MHERSSTNRAYIVGVWSFASFEHLCHSHVCVLFVSGAARMIRD